VIACNGASNPRTGIAKAPLQGPSSRTAHAVPLKSSGVSSRWQVADSNELGPVNTTRPDADASENRARQGGGGGWGRPQQRRQRRMARFAPQSAAPGPILAASLSHRPLYAGNCAKPTFLDSEVRRESVAKQHNPCLLLVLPGPTVGRSRATLRSASRIARD
jgi:hypothetical protein